MHREKTYSISIERDECKDGKWKVVLRTETGELIGVPLRGVFKTEAVNSQNAIGYAFGYGIRHAKEVLLNRIDQTYWNLDFKKPTED